MTMYFLNYVDRNAIAQARLNDLEDDLGMTGVQFNTCVSMLVHPTPTSRTPTLTNLPFPKQFICWLRLDASSLQYAHHTYQARHIHEQLDACLGRCVGVYGAGAEFRRHGCMSILPGYHRGAVLSRSNVHAVHILHAQRSGDTHCTAILCADSGHGI